MRCLLAKGYLNIFKRKFRQSVISNIPRRQYILVQNIRVPWITVLHKLSKIGKADLKYVYNYRTWSLDVQQRILLGKERTTTQKSKVSYSLVKNLSN